jgi:response regulator RpfG family c-di-GMP phosphodiesterase
MVSFTPEDLEHEILHELKEEIFELYEGCLQNLVELELTPQDKEMQRALFRSVHTIKGDLGLVGFTPMIEVLQYLEDILDMLRRGEISYSNTLHDLVVRLLDTVTTFVDDCVSKGKAEYNKTAIDATSEIIKLVDSNKSCEHENLFKQAIKANSGTQALPFKTEQKQLIEIARIGIPKNIAPDKQADLLFFREIMRPIEKRAGLIEGRSDRIAGLALYINSLSSKPISEEQLAAACYIHDFGLAFVPEGILKKDGVISNTDQKLLRSHVEKSTRLLEHLPAWNEAREIIMHHHERINESGYPQGISGGNICEGAKLLAIVETYITLTLQASTDQKMLSEIDAIIMINKEYKQLFSGKWLRLFNKGMTLYLNQ